ncbi:MAG: type II toxin-antitoxin system PemK/MazF family toxin [Alphaproteobacteria bacterium]|nr:type II toxin-antitoxin system PemK/MazF family toxin [Alphaproteobacteria bacterium]
MEPRVRAAPKIRQLYWCDFPEDAQLPELWKVRPVIILSLSSTLYSTVTVIPCSSQAQTDKTTFPLRTTIDGKASWAICDKISSVAVSRLSPAARIIKRVPDDEFQDILKLVWGCLPLPKND